MPKDVAPNKSERWPGHKSLSGSARKETKDQVGSSRKVRRNGGKQRQGSWHEGGCRRPSMQGTKETFREESRRADAVALSTPDQVESAWLYRELKI